MIGFLKKSSLVNFLDNYVNKLYDVDPEAKKHLIIN
jgi:hypothetical protein